MEAEGSEPMPEAAPPKSAPSSASSVSSKASKNSKASKTSKASRKTLQKSPSRINPMLSMAGAATALTGAIKLNAFRKRFDEEPITTHLSSKVWDIYTLPPSNTVKGKVVPRIFNRFARRRKISLEVHRITPRIVPEDEEEEDDHGTDKKKEEEKDEAPQKEYSYEECVIRVLVPATKDVEKAAQKAGQEIRKGAKKEKISQELHEASIRGAASIDSSVIHTDEDATVATDPDGLLPDTGGRKFIGWKARYRVNLSSITITHQQKKSVFVLIENREVRQERELLFDSYKEARAFVDELELQRRLEEDRTDRRLHDSLGDIKLQKNEMVDMLVEVVSGWNLPIGDLTTSDPYVVCKMGRKELHKTKHISGTLDPVWTVKTDSLFLWSLPAKELFLSEGMSCLVKDHDVLGNNDTLGVFAITPRKIYCANGERMEFKLRNPPGHIGEKVPGHIAIRIRRATSTDKNFMASLQDSSKAVRAVEHPKASNNTIKSIVTRYQKIDSNGVKNYKVRPRPDPHNIEPIEWMSDDEIQHATMQESRQWIDAGTGDLGQLHVEVLGCDDLPNLDAGGFAGNKTDAFVSLVFEDCHLRTNVIDDCLSPRWLPWSNRAFIFQIYHPSSQLLLGVFDFDGGLDDHDLIGRVSVDVASLRRNTEYVLTYNIYPTARVSGRKAEGTITIRVRLDMNRERKAVLAALEPPPPIYVNTARKKDFKVIRATCLGGTDVDRYSMKIITSYIEELKEYQQMSFFLQDAAMTVLLWRGHFQLDLGSHTFMVPVHSIVAFLFAVYLVERPQLIPSFFFASVAWALLAIVGWRGNSKNIWTQCKSYQEMLEALIIGNSRKQPLSYAPFHHYDDAKSEIEDWQKRLKDADAAAEEAYHEAQVAEQERLKELGEVGDGATDISTGTGVTLSIDPVRKALFPVQQVLGSILLKLRFAKNIAIWEECYFSFWITTACIILSIVCLFVPWFFLMKWISRIVIWMFFGPWMKLVDLFYVSKLKPETAIEKKARKARERLQRKMANSKVAAQARERREDAAKLKEMKTYMFGKFSMRIPILKEDRYYDRPLPQSTAVPFKLKSMSLAELAMREAGYNRTRQPGQNLVGHMIPVPETETFTAAPVGQATAQPEQLSKEAPGSNQKTGGETTTVAYAKIGSAVVAAGAFTWFTVPLIAGLAEKAVEVVL